MGECWISSKSMTAKRRRANRGGGSGELPSNNALHLSIDSVCAQQMNTENAPAPADVDVRESGLGLALVLGLLALPGIVPLVSRGHIGVALAIGSLLVGVAVVFSSLRVRVRNGRLTVRFGGMWTVRDVPIEALVSVRRVPIPALAGVGLRLLPTGTLYSVGLGDAVEFGLRDGSRFFVSVAQPDALCAQLQANISAGETSSTAAQ
jgi:hypothetical protein